MLLFAAAYYDCRYGRIPNWLIATGMAAGILFAVVQINSVFLSHSCTAIFLLIIFYPFFSLGLLGAGDVKLFSLLGLYLLPSQILFSLFYAFLIAAGYLLFRHAWNLLIIQNRNNRYSVRQIPLALPVLIGVSLQLGGSLL